MKAFIPFKVETYPIKKLGIIPFENNPEKIYRSFEIQYIDDESRGTGYRMLAYRNDKYVDVYDDYSLVFDKDEEFDVVENGCNKHVQVKFENTVMEKRGLNEIISFRFRDIEGRLVDVYYEEKATRGSKPMNLPAPVGYGSTNPTFLPIFFMYNFDFLRRKAQMHCRIDDTELEIDKFPIPMGGQMRTFARYSNQCNLLAFAQSEDGEIKEVELDSDMAYVDENVKYQFNKDGALEKINACFKDETVVVSFEPALDISKEGRIKFSINPKEEMGYIAGDLCVKKNNDRMTLNMVPTLGWKSVPTTLISRIILSEKSMFCSWAKNYEYNATIDLNNKTIQSSWVNHQSE